MSYVLLVIGFIILIKGADFFVDGASSIAKIAKMPTLLIGLTIVAFGTSAPEAAVSINAALKGSNDIAIGNIIGSNIFNLLVAVGLSAMIRPIKVQKTTIIKEYPLSIYSVALLIILSLDNLFAGNDANLLTRGDGLILLLGFGVFMFYLIEMAVLSKEADDEVEEIVKLPLSKSIIFSILGLVGIVFGGDMVVKSATDIALHVGMSETLVGLTIVAVGTSLPELVTSVTAARKGESDIAIGNIIGSGLFNIFFVLGVSATIHPIAVSSKLIFDFIILAIVTVISHVFAYSKKEVDKKEGFALTAMYIAYMVYIIIRN
ncbi:cation:H+ antiporter [Acetoanaerobium noterae]|uniref:Cation:H+ antiporter n=1 Tax=Acetoanaerobium noterae TaxID=745369 RepID=A0A1T5BSD6_9FIRM|nr:calcium/sodium antiporter [Acetoanaerobium noterae]SKB50272.1 cation:H+ antiporter [Acetoanaerobium noterae]